MSDAQQDQRRGWLEQNVQNIVQEEEVVYAVAFDICILYIVCTRRAFEAAREKQNVDGPSAAGGKGGDWPSASLLRAVGRGSALADDAATWMVLNRATVQILSFTVFLKQSSPSKSLPRRQENVRQIDPLRHRRHPHLHVPRRHQA